MAAGRIILPVMPALDRNGNTVSGAQLFFYDNGTTTPKAVYTTSALTTQHAQPVVADSAGSFPAIWADEGELYSVTAYAPTGQMLPHGSFDDVGPTETAVSTTGAAQIALINTAGTTQLDAVTAEGEAQVASVTAEGDSQSDRLESEADGLIATILATAGPRYPDTATGLAAVAEGEYFLVVSPTADIFASVYRDIAGVAVWQSDISSHAFIKAMGLPPYPLPTSIKHAYRWRLGSGTVIRDLIGGDDIDLSDTALWTGYSTDANGWVKLIAQAGLLPAMDHRWMVHDFMTPEGGSTGIYFGTARTGGTAVGKNYGSAIATGLERVVGLHGPGVHDVYRDDGVSGNGAYEFECGAPIAIAIVDTATTASDANARPSIGTTVHTPVSLAAADKVGEITNFYTLVGDDEPTDDDLQLVRQWLRYAHRADFLAPLTADDCPRKAVLVIANGDQMDGAETYSSGTASFSGTTMTVTATGGANYLVLPAQEILATGLPVGVAVVEQLTGTTGGAGTYRLNTDVGALSSRAFTYSGAPTEDILVNTPEVLVNAYDFASRAAPGRRMGRMSMRAGFRNDAAVTSTPGISWATGYRSYFNEAPTDGRDHHLLRLAASNTFIVPVDSYSNTLGGTTNVLANDTRHPETTGSNGVGAIHHLLNRHFWKAEGQARLRGIGYDTIVFYESAGFWDSFVLGTAAFPNAEATEDMANAKRDYAVRSFGIANPLLIFAKPTAPELGSSALFPNDATGADRLEAAINAGAGFDRAALMTYTTLTDDDTSYDQVNGTFTPAGIIAKGRRAGALVRSRLSTLAEPALADDPALVSPLELHGSTNTTLKAALADIIAGTGRAYLSVLGDSLTVGFGAGTGTGGGQANGARPNRWSAVMARLLTTAGITSLDAGIVGGGGMGATGSNILLYDARITASWPVTLNQSYAGGGHFTSALTAFSVQDTGDTARYVFEKLATTYTFAIDGAVPDELYVDGVLQAAGTATYTPTAGSGFVEVVVRAASSASRTFSVTASSTAGRMRSVNIYDSGAAAFDILNHASNSATALDMAQTSGSVLRLDSLGYDEPAMTIVMADVNQMDYSVSNPGTYTLANYITSLEAIVDTALLTGDCLMVFSPPVADSAYDGRAVTFRDAAKDVADDKGVAFLDLFEYYGRIVPATTDTVHPTAPTQLEIGRAITTAVMIMAGIPD